MLTSSRASAAISARWNRRSAERRLARFVLHHALGRRRAAGARPLPPFPCARSSPAPPAGLIRGGAAQRNPQSRQSDRRGHRRHEHRCLRRARRYADAEIPGGAGKAAADDPRLQYLHHRRRRRQCRRASRAGRRRSAHSRPAPAAPICAAGAEVPTFTDAAVARRHIDPHNPRRPGSSDAAAARASS